jgi:hypothetical protein
LHGTENVAAGELVDLSNLMMDVGGLRGERQRTHDLLQRIYLGCGAGTLLCE